MSRENMDLVRSIFTGWGRGDYGSAEWAHPEIEFVKADGIEPGSWTAVSGMVECWRNELRAWNDHRVEAEEYRELDDKRVLVLVRSRGRGKTSGMEVDQISAPGANVFHLRDGKVTRLVTYWAPERALAGLGLED
jgi:ketosteroid isomerase-like protein